jgi:cytochrome P450
VDSQLDDISNLENTPHSSPSPNEKLSASAFDTGNATLAKRTRFKDKILARPPPDFITSCKASHDFIDHFVRLALSKAKNKTKLEASKHVFLESLAAETQDPIELRSQSLHILLAGRDTTASLLSWLFFSLARSPAHYAKLHAVVLEQFGTYDVPMNITFASLKGCKYL